MSFTLWWMLIREALFPATWWWGLIVLFAPLAVAALWLALFGPKRPVTADGTWRFVGQSWLLLGIVLTSVAILLYIVMSAFVYSRPNHDDGYLARVTSRSGEVATRSLKGRAQAVVKNVDQEELREWLRNYVLKMPADKRVGWMEAVQASNINGYVVKLNDLLDWSPDKIQKYKAEHNGLLPAEVATNLPFDNAQRSLWAAGKFGECYEGLRENQWKYVVDQILNPQEQVGLANLTSDMIGNFIGGRDGVACLGELIKLRVASSDTRQGKVMVSTYLATGGGASYPAFWFFCQHVRWIRDFHWLLLNLIVGLCVWLQAVGIARSPKLFQGCSPDGKTRWCCPRLDVEQKAR
jgi:hypothetical protein